MLKKTALPLLTLLLLLPTLTRAQGYFLPEISEPFISKLIALAKLNYPKSKSIELKVKMADDNIKKVKNSWLDFVSFSASYSPSNTTTLTGLSLSGYQASMSVNLAGLLQKKYSVRQSKDDYTMALLSRDDYYISLESDVRSRYIKYLQQAITLKVQNQNAVEIFASYKLIKYKYEKAEENFDSYSKALISYTEIQQNIIASEAALYMAKINLEELIGKKLEDIR
jgi:outer membrane protein TolC